MSNKKPTYDDALQDVLNKFEYADVAAIEGSKLHEVLEYMSDTYKPYWKTKLHKQWKEAIANDAQEEEQEEEVQETPEEQTETPVSDSPVRLEPEEEMYNNPPEPEEEPVYYTEESPPKKKVTFNLEQEEVEEEGENESTEANPSEEEKEEEEESFTEDDFELSDYVTRGEIIDLHCAQTFNYLNHIGELQNNITLLKVQGILMELLIVYLMFKQLK